MKQNKAELFILGSGTCIPTHSRTSPGIILKIADRILLIDSGSGTLSKLIKIGMDHRDLDYIFYTHFHPDHIIDLFPILQAIYVLPPSAEKKSLDIFGPPNFLHFIELQKQAFGQNIFNPSFEVNFNELNRSDKLSLPFCEIRTAPMKHSEYSIGYRIEFENKSITISGDTDYCEQIIYLAKDTDILILECSLPDSQKINGHLTPTLAASIAAEANCHHLVLTHFYPACENVDIKSICQKIFPGKITLSYDFMSVPM